MWARHGGCCFTLPVVLAGCACAAFVQEDNNQKVLLALCGAFILSLSALKIPSVTGSCSHPTGVDRRVILFVRRGGDPYAIVLLFRGHCCWRTAG